jgi:cytoskeleton protein RodZ
MPFLSAVGLGFDEFLPRSVQSTWQGSRNAPRMRVGAELKAARKKAGLTLEVISKRIKISVSKLDALEKNDFKNLPTGLYLFSAVRAYAREVRIDPEPLVERLRAEFAEKDTLDALHALDATGALGAKNLADASNSKSNLLRVAAIAAGVVLMTAGAGTYLLNSGLISHEVRATTEERLSPSSTVSPSETSAVPLSSPAPATTVATAVDVPQQAAAAPKPRTAAVMPEPQETVRTELPSPARIEEPDDRPAEVEEPGSETPVLAAAP